MRVRSRRVLLAWSMTALAMLAGCGPSSVDTSIGTTSAPVSSVSTTPAPTIAAPPMPVGPETHKWVDLKVGDCIAGIPAVDLGAVAVSIVDCADAHAAEVYLRAPVEVNAAITDVANRECVSGFADYTGRSVEGSPYAVTYLIDSNQDRTANNPLPSTVICLLQSTSGRPLTGPARS